MQEAKNSPQQCAWTSAIIFKRFFNQELVSLSIDLPSAERKEGKLNSPNDIGHEVILACCVKISVTIF